MKSGGVPWQPISMAMKDMLTYVPLGCEMRKTQSVRTWYVFGYEGEVRIPLEFEYVPPHAVNDSMAWYTIWNPLAISPHVVVWNLEEQIKLKEFVITIKIVLLVLTSSILDSWLIGWEEGFHCHISCPGEVKLLMSHLWSQDNHCRSQCPCLEMSAGWHSQWIVWLCRHILPCLGNCPGRMVRWWYHLASWNCLHKDQCLCTSPLTHHYHFDIPDPHHKPTAMECIALCHFHNWSKLNHNLEILKW